MYIQNQCKYKIAKILENGEIQLARVRITIWLDGKDSNKNFFILVYKNCIVSKTFLVHAKKKKKKVNLTFKVSV